VDDVMHHTASQHINILHLCHNFSFLAFLAFSFSFSFWLDCNTIECHCVCVRAVMLLHTHALALLQSVRHQGYVRTMHMMMNHQVAASNNAEDDQFSPAHG
jgi:hypothetical protein